MIFPLSMFHTGNTSYVEIKFIFTNKEDNQVADEIAK